MRRSGESQPIPDGGGRDSCGNAIREVGHDVLSLGACAPSFSAHESSASMLLACDFSADDVSRVSVSIEYAKFSVSGPSSILSCVMDPPITIHMDGCGSTIARKWMAVNIQMDGKQMLFTSSSKRWCVKTLF